MDKLYKKTGYRKEKIEKILKRFIFLEVIVFVFLVVYSVMPYLNLTGAIVGENNVTVTTLLQVGTVAPEILNITINNGNAITLTANATTSVQVYAIVRDYNNDTDIVNATVRFFDNGASSYGAADDNNHHYTNNTCAINYAYGDAYHANVTCFIGLLYYANNATWNASVTVTDNSSLTDFNSALATVNTLLALGLPNSIDYGVVNGTTVSTEKIANVTNFGNVIFNLTLYGYGAVPNDNLSMNCSLGNVQNISIAYEKYNLTTSNTSVLNLTQFESIYLNLTGSSVIKNFNSPQRQNDTQAHVDDTNSTYWRIYVPRGVAGTCSGNIVFGAVQTAGT